MKINKDEIHFLIHMMSLYIIICHITDIVIVRYWIGLIVFGIYGYLFDTYIGIYRLMKPLRKQFRKTLSWEDIDI